MTCKMCGQRLRAGTATYGARVLSCPRCGAPISDDMDYCENCKQELGEKLAYLPAVRMVDTSDVQYDKLELRELRGQYPKLRFLFKVRR